MKSFMTTGSLSRGMEVDEGPIEGDAMPFPREDVVMMIFGRHPSLEKCRGLDPSTQTPSHSNQGWGGGTWKCKGLIFYCTLTYVKIYVFMYIASTQKIKGEEIAGGVA
jgi:hypothetical protein